MSLVNRFSTALSQTKQPVTRKDGPRKNDIVVGGVNYGRTWDDEDQVAYDLYLKSLEFDNNVDMIDYINQYNSPAAQVARYHDAGLNPALQNIDGGTAQGQTTSAPSAPDGISHLERTQQIANFSQQFLELIPQAIQMYQSIQGGFLDLDQKALSVQQGLDSTAQSELVKQLSLHDISDPKNVPRISMQHLPKRLRKRVEDNYISYLDDFNNRDLPRSFVYRAKFQGETARQEYLGLLSKYGYNVNDDAFVKVLKSFNEVISESQKSHAKYTTDYHSNKKGKELAETENKEVEKRGTVAENDVYADLMKKANDLIDSKDKSDKVGGYIMYLLLGLMNSTGAIDK